MQVYFVDNTYRILDSILTTPSSKVIEGATQGPPPTYRVVNTTTKYTETTINAAKLLKIKNSSKMLIRAVINTKDYPNTVVRIYSDYILDIKISVQVKAKINY